MAETPKSHHFLPFFRDSYPPPLSHTLLEAATIYCILSLLYISYRYFSARRGARSAMLRSPFIMLHALLFTFIGTLAYAQSSSLTSFSSLTTSTSSSLATSTSTSTAERPIFTVPASADEGANLIPNIFDPIAVDAQTACPGYVAENVAKNKYGMTAMLRLNGAACNVYGTDIEALNLTVEYQASDRLSVKITPTYITAENSSWFILPETLIPSPKLDSSDSDFESDLEFVYSNDPTFSFSVLRKATGETIFSTEGSKLVYENQFIEFVTELPEEYNLYGLGETIHGLRLGNNLTRTLFAADAADTVDGNM